MPYLKVIASNEIKKDTNIALRKFESALLFVVKKDFERILILMKRRRLNDCIQELVGRHTSLLK
jgi:hypothetical protein